MSLIYSSDSSDDDGEVVYGPVNHKKRLLPARSLRGKPRGVKTLRCSKDKNNDDNDDGHIPPSWDNNEEDEGSMVPPNVDLTWDHYDDVDPECPDKMLPMAFCCAHCKCDEEKRELYNNRMAVADDGFYWHRHCCHNILVDKVDDDWQPPRRQCELYGEAEVPTEEVFTEYELKKMKKNAKRKATQTVNEDELEDPVFLMATSPIYEKNREKHREEVLLRAQSRQPAVVMDAFGGIGAAIVALKRLQIAISKIIHIEHDMVAMHVARYCHDRSYNETLPPDGIQEHVYESKFENIFNNLDDFMSKHGPIDIIVGGPPCSDFSGLNAYAGGTEGTQGQLLPKFGELINRIQAHKEQQEKPLYFLVENVKFCKDKFKNYDAVDKAIGTTHSIWDSKIFSPCQRNRTYWLNFPVKSIACGFNEAAKISPNSCLEDGWSMAATEENFDKANTFLASKTRLDADAMLKMKREGQKFIKGYYSPLERERMMGLPDGYAKNAVTNLFETLLRDALGREDAENDPWSASLDKKFLCFSGEEFKYGLDQHRNVYLKMSPPTTNKNREFFSADQYAKHLIGNSFSIPVVEHLLTQLRPLFASREYAGYTYKYCWDQFQK